MLATVRIECAATWQPIEEYGKGKGKKYDKVIDVTDPVTQKIYRNVYYGRGYVQLTWEKNYQKVGKMLGVGDRYYINPEKILNHDVSYKTMSLGMRKGIFSGLKIAQFISGMKTDYVGARQVINGNDHAIDVAKDAVKFEEFLKASVVTVGDYNVGSFANYA